MNRITASVAQEDRELIERAYEVAERAHAGQTRASGEPYIVHSLAVALMLADLHLDPKTIAAGLLHDVPEDTSVTIDQVRDMFGEEVASLVDGVTKLSQIDRLSSEGRTSVEEQRAESLRKMFLAMVHDVRVVLIKLADRLHNMRTLGALPEDKRRRIAQETLDIFAPLANRLGFWQLKWELEDLSFRYLDPEMYHEIAQRIAERRGDRERQIAQVAAILKERLHEAGIEAEVDGRPKHIYSIYRKMQRKGLDFDQIYDVQGVRVIVDTVTDCYASLGVVHSLWTPIPGEFDDYIATPKDNMYQSLHTAVVGPDGKPLEVQIRTHEMHRTAEYGIAAHWRYKEGSKQRDLAFEKKIAWLRSLMEWRQEVASASEFLDSMKTDVFQDRVYVFTPKGEIIDLPAGSTPIDFAYHIHSEIGDRCRGAKVNGRLVSLDYQLRTGDQVEIITAKRGGPSRDWLNPHLGYVKTSRAQQKIRQWFKKQDRAENIAQGRAIVERELKRLGLEDVNLEQLGRALQYDKVDDLFAAVGYGDVSIQNLTTKALEIEREVAAELPLPPTTPPRPPTVSTSEVTVTGVGNLLTTLAKCCNPLPGDDIVGYITRGRGVTIHRRDCPNLLARTDRERLIQVDWGVAKRQTYPVKIEVSAYDRGGLLRDIAAVVADEKASMSAVNARTDKRDNTAIFTATLEIEDIDQLSRILTRIYRLPNVLEVRRQTH
ncbi:MAG: bifunctional (p)ppGpp synthetase/guanosine-3',5'-bis(diphosphate) 3'-pyrophosphohydrolase [Anaerolineales bacterium]